VKDNEDAFFGTVVFKRKWNEKKMGVSKEDTLRKRKFKERKEK
jgi:hypothetical protein